MNFIIGPSGRNTFILIFSIIFSALISQSVEGKVASALERKALEQLRPLVKDVLYKEYMKEDIYLIAWLRVYSSDPVKTGQSIRKAHQWRKDVNIENVVKGDFSKFEKEFPLTFEGHDREGRPLVILPFGLWNVRKIVISGETAKYKLYLYRMQEIMSQKARATFNVTVPTAKGSRDAVEWVILHDLMGYNNRQQGCLGCIPLTLSYAMDTENYYGNYVSTVYIVNMPRIFETVLGTIKNFLSQFSREAIKAYGHNKEEFSAALLKDFAPDQLPLAYGGTKH